MNPVAEVKEVPKWMPAAGLPYTYWKAALPRLAEPTPIAAAPREGALWRPLPDRSYHVLAVVLNDSPV